MATVVTTDPVLTITPDHIVAIDRAIMAMRDRPDDPFTLDVLAEIAAFSSFHFARLFRQIVGIPPGEFLTALRYDRAKMLLLTTDISVTELCFEVGYDSLGTFSSTFKRLVGVGPATFRSLLDVLDALQFRDDEPSVLHAHGSSAASVAGHFMNARELPGEWVAYVGLFPAAIARSRPVTGMHVLATQPFALTHVPRGSFRILSAAVPVTSTAHERLLPTQVMRVADYHEMIHITSGSEQIVTPLRLRALRPQDPPVLISLPALDLLRVDLTSPITRDAMHHLSAAVKRDVARVATA